MWRIDSRLVNLMVCLHNSPKIWTSKTLKPLAKEANKAIRMDNSYHCSVIRTTMNHQCQRSRLRCKILRLIAGQTMSSQLRMRRGTHSSRSLTHIKISYHTYILRDFLGIQIQPSMTNSTSRSILSQKAWWRYQKTNRIQEIKATDNLFMTFKHQSLGEDLPDGSYHEDRKKYPTQSHRRRLHHFL